MDEVKLFMLLVGCRPKGRNTEQHDVFFGVGHTLKDLLPQLSLFWPEAKASMHIDAWREVTCVNGFNVQLSRKTIAVEPTPAARLFFINLGGYKQQEFEEFHYKMLLAAPDKDMAIQQAKQTAFYKHTGFKGAPSHVDDKFGIDVDDLYEIREILLPAAKALYTVQLSHAETAVEDTLHLGYLPLTDVLTDKY